MLLGQMGVADVVSPVVLSVVHGRCKPHPSIYLHALAEAGVEAQNTLFVGDTVLPDHTAPTRLGIRSVLVGRHPDVPTDESVDHILDLESIVLGSPRTS